MKKIIYLFVILAAALSCSDDKEDDLKTTYQIVNNTQLDAVPTIDYLDGSMWEVVVFCFDETGDVVKEDNIEPVMAGGGLSNKIEVADYIHKVVVSFKFLPRESGLYNMDTNTRRYSITRFVVTPGENTLIEIDENSMLRKTLSAIAVDDEPLINAIKLKL